MIAFIFPGQGSQNVGMGKALAGVFPICRETFAEAGAALGEPLSRTCFKGPEEPLTLTGNAQPAMLAVSTAGVPAAGVEGPCASRAGVFTSQVGGGRARLASEGVTTYVEVGPGTVLNGLVRKIHREATVMSFGSPEDLAALEPLSA